MLCLGCAINISSLSGAANTCRSVHTVMHMQLATGEEHQVQVVLVFTLIQRVKESNWGWWLSFSLPEASENLKMWTIQCVTCSVCCLHLCLYNKSGYGEREAFFLLADSLVPGLLCPFGMITQKIFSCKNCFPQLRSVKWDGPYITTQGINSWWEVLANARLLLFISESLMRDLGETGWASQVNILSEDFLSVFINSNAQIYMNGKSISLKCFISY